MNCRRSEERNKFNFNFLLKKKKENKSMKSNL